LLPHVLERIQALPVVRTGSLSDVPRHPFGTETIRDWKRRFLGEIRCGTMKRCRHGFQRLSLYHTALVVLLANQPPAVVSAAFQQRIQASPGVQRRQCQTSGLHHKFERPPLDILPFWPASPVLWSFDAQQIDADSSADLLDIRSIPNVTEYVQSLREKARVLREEALLLEFSLQQSSAARAAQRAQQVDQWIQHLFFDESNQDKNESSALNHGAGSDTSNTSEASTPSAQATKQWYKRFRIPDQLPYWARKLQWKAASRRYRRDVISFQPFISGEFDARIEKLKTKLADGKYSGPQLMRVLDRLWELQKPPVTISGRQVATGNSDGVTITLQIGDGGNNTSTGSWNVTEAQKLRFCINDLIFASQQLDEAKTTEQPGRLSNALQSRWSEIRRADELNFHRNLAATVHDAMQIADANRTSIEDYIRQTWNSTGALLSKPNATTSGSVNVTQMMNPSATTPLWIPTSLLSYVLTCPDRVTSDDIRTMREKVLGSDFFCTSLEKIPNAVIFRGNVNVLRIASTKSAIRSAMAASNDKKETGRLSTLTRIAIQAKGCWIEMKNNARARKERRIASRWVFSKLQLQMRSTGLAERLQLFFLPDPEWRPSARDAEPPPVIIALPRSAQPGASNRSRINVKGLKVSN
jgi:hypothetical protein